MKDFFHLLPSRIGLERDLTLAEAEQHFIHPCGDAHQGKVIYKLLTCESIMLTYYEINGMLVYQGTSQLHDVA